MLKIVLIVCIVSIVPSENARILGVFPFPSISHQIVFRPLIQELVKRGHEVTVITPDPAFPKGETPANFTEIDIHDASYKIWRENVVSKTEKPETVVDQMREMLEASNKIYDQQYQDEQVLGLIRDKNKQFDLLLTEACVRQAIVFSHFYKVPVIQVSSFTGLSFNYDAMGISAHPILYPSIFRQKLFNLTLWDKITELYNHYAIEYLIDKNEKLENDMLRRRLGPSIPPLSELKQNIDMLFLNVHPIFQGIRPVPPSVIYMGGLHQKPEKPLPQDLKSYLDSSKNGVIYVSFGTNVDPTSLPPEKIKILVRVFSQLPYDILWKWNNDELPGQTANIKISKWLPQSDLLRHPKIKLFITQGGLQSTDEAITAGVPLIGIPMLGDQWFNVEQYLRLKIGLRVDMETITEEKLMASIKTILGDKSYRQNILNLRRLITDQPQKPLDRAIWWIEYVVRNGGAKHLKSPSVNISWWEYLEIELILIVVGISLAISLVLAFIVLSLSRYVVRNYISKFKIKDS